MLSERSELIKYERNVFERAFFFLLLELSKEGVERVRFLKNGKLADLKFVVK